MWGLKYIRQSSEDMIQEMNIAIECSKEKFEPGFVVLQIVCTAFSQREVIKLYMLTKQKKKEE